MNCKQDGGFLGSVSSGTAKSIKKALLIYELEVKKNSINFIPHRNDAETRQKLKSFYWLRNMTKEEFCLNDNDKLKKAEATKKISTNRDNSSAKYNNSRSNNWRGDNHPQRFNDFHDRDSTQYRNYSKAPGQNYNYNRNWYNGPSGQQIWDTRGGFRGGQVLEAEIKDTVEAEIKDMEEEQLRK